MTLTCNFIELRCPCSIHSWFKYPRGTTISDPLIREVLDAWRLNSNKLWNLSTQKYPQAWSKSNGYGIVCGVRFRKETHRLRANRQWTRVGRVLHGWKKTFQVKICSDLFQRALVLLPTHLQVHTFNGFCT